MFSLCIPTMDRYDNFLSKYLLDYLDNELINEIIITDETGKDVEKIILNLRDHKNFNKMVLIVNDKKLGPFLNKYKACLKAKNEWIALIDSDNFADKQYFEVVKEYISTQLKGEKNIILAPSKAKPNFNYSHLAGLVYKKNNFKINNQIERANTIPNNTSSLVLMNTGNYVLNKYLIDNLNLSNEMKNIQYSSSSDVIYFNTLLFEQLDLNLHVVPNLEYNHVVHSGSIYTQTAHTYRDFANAVTIRYLSLI